MFRKRFIFGCGIALAISVSPLQIFSQQNSITTVSATPTAANVGDAVSIAATVAGQTNTIPIPTGSVTFLDGSTSLGTANLSSLAIAAPKIVSFAQLFGSNNGENDGTPILWADLNGDGKPDMLGYEFPYIVFLNNGGGNFTQVPFNPTLYSQPTPIDFNGDGKVDLLMFGASESDLPVTLQVSYGNGDGTFQPTIAVSGFMSGASYLTSADLTGGGLPFILLGQNATPSSNASITVYKNNGHGSFTSLGNFPVSTSNTNSQTILQILPVDLNGDGKLDLAVALHNGDYPTDSTSVTVLLNQGDGNFGTPVTTLAGSSCGNEICGSAIVAGDFASRKKTDLAVLNNSDLEVYPGNGDGTFGTALPVTSAQSCRFGITSNSILVAEDINGDGRLDLIECGPIAYLGNGDFSFTPTQIAPNGTLPSYGSVPGAPLSTLGSKGVNGVYLGDFDGDGVPDLLFPYEVTSTTYDSVVCSAHAILLLRYLLSKLFPLEHIQSLLNTVGTRTSLPVIPLQSTSR